MATTNEEGDIGGSAARTPGQFPHVNIRVVNGEPEPYILNTGLAVWEVAWLARAYGGDAQEIARHTLADRELVEEGLHYAAEHAAEIDAQIAQHTERSLDELLELLPGMRVFTFDAGEPTLPRSIQHGRSCTFNLRRSDLTMRHYRCVKVNLTRSPCGSARRLRSR